MELASLVHGLGSLQVFPRQELLVPLVAQIEATLHECNAQGELGRQLGYVFMEKFCIHISDVLIHGERRWFCIRPAHWTIILN